MEVSDKSDQMERKRECDKSGSTWQVMSEEQMQNWFNSKGLFAFMEQRFCTKAILLSRD